jgi:hypothetical protein
MHLCTLLMYGCYENQMKDGEGMVELVVTSNTLLSACNEIYQCILLCKEFNSRLPSLLTESNTNLSPIQAVEHIITHMLYVKLI